MKQNRHRSRLRLHLMKKNYHLLDIIGMMCVLLLVIALLNGRWLAGFVFAGVTIATAFITIRWEAQDDAEGIN